METERMDLIPLTTRREFLKRTAASAVASAAALGSAVGEAAAAATTPPTKRKHHWGMVIDTRRCVGCEACVIACKIENKTPPGVYYTVVTREPLPGARNDRPVFMTKPCFHCEQPPCVSVCPVGATFKRAEDGIVVVDYDRCIGCRYCMAACPYGARWFDFGEDYELAPEAGAVVSPEYRQYRVRTPEGSPVGNVRKCTFCLHLQDENGEYDREAVAGRPVPRPVPATPSTSVTWTIPSPRFRSSSASGTRSASRRSWAPNPPFTTSTSEGRR
jgi:Fe-S-cluster-containing dehydrogenase component